MCLKLKMTGINKLEGLRNVERRKGSKIETKR